LRCDTNSECSIQNAKGTKKVERSSEVETIIKHAIYYQIKIAFIYRIF